MENIKGVIDSRSAKGIGSVRGIGNLKLWGLYFLSAFLCYYFFGGFISIANDFYRFTDPMVWRTVAYAGLNDCFLFDHKGPYHHWFNMLGLWLSYDKWGIFWLCVLNMSCVLAVIDKITCLYSNSKLHRVTTCLCFIIFFIITKGEGLSVESNSLLFQFVPLYLFLKYNRTRSSQGHFPLKWTFIMGLCFGFLALIRLNNACINVAVVLVLAYMYIKGKNFVALMRHIGVFAVGMVITAIPVVCYFGGKGVLDQVIHATFVYNMRYSSGTGITLMESENIVWSAAFLLSHIVIILLPMPAIIFALWKKNGVLWSNEFLLYTVFSIIVLCLYTNSAGFGHYFMVVAPTMVMAVVHLNTVDYSDKMRILSVACFFVVTIALYSKKGFVNLRSDVAVNILPKSLRENVSWCREYSEIYNDCAAMKAECNKIAQMIPDTDKKDIYFTGGFYYRYKELVCHCNIIPVGKYFYAQEMHMRHDPQVGKEIHKFLDTNTPRWIVSEVDAEDGYIKPYLSLYELVYTTPDGVLNLWKAK